MLKLGYSIDEAIEAWGTYIMADKLRMVEGIDCMMCGMCESYINDTIRAKMPVKKVSSSHKMGITVIISETELSTEMITAALVGSGYTVMSVICEPYEKKGFSAKNK